MKRRVWMNTGAGVWKGATARLELNANRPLLRFYTEICLCLRNTYVRCCVRRYFLRSDRYIQWQKYLRIFCNSVLRQFFC